MVVPPGVCAIACAESAQIIARASMSRAHTPVLRDVRGFFIMSSLSCWGKEGVALLHAHFVGSGELAALRQRIGPFIADVRVHRCGGRDALDRSVGLLLFNR